ncbi:flagellin N-terminal helical domain-containing protein [Bacillus cereus group sp. MYBK79-1]|uniref:flagellin N-terminal helical domain-containing protein n=1 Tax=unclassified Bacillus cereus group TaxID=2750818 RepID=UPI003F78EF32
MRINTNINSMRTQEYMRQNQAKMSNAMDRLSSGKRINNASDDAAGLAIATRMRARESGLGVAADNTQNGISLIRTADSALGSVSNILLRMRDLANQSATGTNTKENQSALNKEFDALKEQIDYIANNTQFNDKDLLNADKATPNEIKIQTLDSDDDQKQITITLHGATREALGIDTLSIAEGQTTSAPKGVQLAQDAQAAFKKDFAAAKTDDEKTAAFTAFKNAWATAKTDYTNTKTLDDKIKAYDPLDAGAAITDFDAGLAAATANAGTAKPNALLAVKEIDAALETIANNRADLGATLNRLDFNVNNLKSQASSMASAASQVEDADMAKEMSEMTKFKILNEAGISMLSQANQTPQMVSKLLQ